MYEHKYSVLNPFTVKIPVSKHFSSKKYGVKDMGFSVVEWFKQDLISNKSHKLKRENFWIWTFGSLHPYGLSEMM